MQLFLLRHAPAHPVDPAIVEASGIGAAEAARRLTPRGRRRFRAAVRGLRRLDVRFDRILCSPWARASETADLVAERLDGTRTTTERLVGPPTEDLLEELRGDRIAVIGHQPWLGELAGWLITDRRELGDRLEWKKGGLLWLEGEPRPGGMRVMGAWSPKVLRRLG
jgi:phosphohistidine phosphatase